MKINRILVSQPAPVVAEKSPYNELNVAVDYRPFIRVEGVSLKEFRSQRIEILEHTAVIFTSRTSIDHFFRIAEQARITMPETMKYICNTEATALYLQKYIVYRKRKIFFADGSFKSLMELVMKHKDERYLLVLSEPHNPEIPETLRRLGIKFDQVILSRTVSSDLSDLNIGDYDMLVFFSPSEIAAYLQYMSEKGNGAAQGDTLLATFGEGTTRAALDSGLTVNVMAPTPAAPSMAKAIGIYIKQLASGAALEPVQLGDSTQAQEFVRNHESKPRRRTAAKV
jgi:uroporphyrinogen-III synthase